MREDSKARRGGVKVTTTGDAIAQYASERLPTCEATWSVGVESVLEIVASFCDELGPELVDALARRRLRGRLHDPEFRARDALGADALFRLLAPCVRLFPFQIVAGAGILTIFRDEIPRLARWLGDEGFARDEDRPAFETAWAEALPDIARHTRLQLALERAVGAVHVPPPDLLVGRFDVVECAAGALVVSNREQRCGPIRVPRSVERCYSPNDEVSLALHRSVAGWRILASSLPCGEGELARRLAALSR